MIGSIQKNQKKSLPQLKSIAVRHFHTFIRDRDKDKPCVSCGKYTTLQAGHFYSAGHYPGLKFDPLNVHGQCVRCNLYLSGNLINYRLRLTNRITQKQLETLDLKASIYKREGYKWDRFFLIETIDKYKDLNRDLKDLNKDLNK
jgi:hypothetical protein